MYKQWNVVDSRFRKIKEFRRVFTQYDKLDETDNAFITLANIAIYLKN
ncbi:MAG: hypothetical protein LBH00_07180 [Planctomycetaceae bacterium]|nr:hypothetical protein [Planctomycetaceae bacterium]